MTNSPQYFPYENPKQKQTLRERFRAEHDRVLELNKEEKTCESVAIPDINPMPLEEYLDENSFIPQQQITSLSPVDPEKLPRTQEDCYHQGTKVCLAIVSFNNGGFKPDNLNPDSQRQYFDDKQFYQEFTINEKGVSNWGGRTGYFHDHFPDKIREDISTGGCTFTVQYDYPTGDYRNREDFAAQKNQALQNLQTIFRQNLN